MQSIMKGFFAAALFVASTIGVAQAQDAPSEAASPEPQAAPKVEAPGSASVMMTTTDPTYVDKRLAYDMYRRDELERGVRRTRNALIGTSAAFGVGLALTIPVWAGDHCVVVTINNQDELTCNTTGKVLLGIGSPLVWGGSIGTLVSGIMFGVRKGKLRRVNERIMLTSERRLRWDLASSRFVF
jgi:hypothetical protein